MPWDGKKLPDALAIGATAAANAAANGGKNNAYLTYLRDQIGADFVMKLVRDDVPVWQATASGSLTVNASRFVLPTSATQNSISAADIDTGGWILRVEKAGDSSKYIATAVTPTGGAGPFRLSADLASDGSVSLGSLLLNSPSFDSAEFYFGSHQHGMGNAFERYTGGSAINFSVVRNHNAEYLETWEGGQVGWWTGISGTTNQYNWTKFDAWCDYHAAKGRRLLLNFYSNPNWTAPDGSSIARNSTPDSWGRAGGSSYVRAAYRENYRQMVANTVSRLVSRMGATFVVAVEAWNEPIGGEGTDGRAADDSQFLKANGYPAYSGTSSIQTLLADITYDIHTGLRSVNSTIPLLVGAGAWGGSWLPKTTAARTSTGVLMLSYGDGFSFHPYGTSDQWKAFNPSYNDWNLTSLTTEIRSALTQGGAQYTNMPLWATECAMFAPFNGGQNAEYWKGWYDADKTDLAQRQYNWVKEYKDKGWKSLITYSVDSGWSNSTPNQWVGGEAGAYQFLGLSGAAMNGAINTQIAAKWSQANADLHSWG